MGSFTFKWMQPAEEVYVTGTFDGWTKSVQLEKVGNSFEKTVELPDGSEKILYKFVVNNDWRTDNSAPIEKDDHGIDNNVLTPDKIEKSAPPTAAIMSGVTPESTTAQLAAAAPLEKKVPEAVAEKAEEVKEDAEKVIEEKKPELSEKVEEAEKTAEESAEAKPSENVGSSSAAEAPVVPGGFPETPATELDKPVSVNPLPAAENGLNPIKLAPGEPVPESVTAEDINKNVKLDKESYEKADALPGDADAAAAAAESMPPVSGNMIPESSLPISSANDVAISSVTPAATTVGLAADAPIETKKETAEVPQVVKESQEEAKAEPEASADSEEVKEKAAVEAELLDKVPEAPSTAEGTAGKGTDKQEGGTTASEAVAAVASAAVAVGGAAVAAVVAAKEAVATESAEKTLEKVSPEVPTEVKESIAEAGASAEAAANTEAVQEKKEVEAELVKKVDEVAPVETKPAESTEAAEAPSESKAAPTNGEAPTEIAAGPSTVASTDATESTQTKKKKNRLSAMFSKLKGKVSHKH